MGEGEFAARSPRCSSPLPSRFGAWSGGGPSTHVCESQAPNRRMSHVPFHMARVFSTIKTARRILPLVALICGALLIVACSPQEGEQATNHDTATSKSPAVPAFNWEASLQSDKPELIVEEFVRYAESGIPEPSLIEAVGQNHAMLEWALNNPARTSADLRKRLINVLALVGEASVPILERSIPGLINAESTQPLEWTLRAFSRSRDRILAAVRSQARTGDPALRFCALTALFQLDPDSPETSDLRWSLAKESSPLVRYPVWLMIEHVDRRWLSGTGDVVETAVNSALYRFRCEDFDSVDLAVSDEVTAAADMLWALGIPEEQVKSTLQAVAKILVDRAPGKPAEMTDEEEQELIGQVSSWMRNLGLLPDGLRELLLNGSESEVRAAILVTRRRIEDLEAHANGLQELRSSKVVEIRALAREIEGTFLRVR